jgi:7-cyano-7-deazaguanine synthase
MNALVILSGGFDSVALLHWVTEKYADIRAVSFDYGQPHRDAELAAAQATAEKLGLNAGNGGWERIRITELGSFDTTPGFSEPSIARAFVPSRNLVFIAYAGNRAARAWPGQRSKVLYGANVDDAAGFADCRRGFVAQASEAVRQGIGGYADVTVGAPWIDLGWRKETILQWLETRPEALAAARLSVSCYLGTRCGKCDSCIRRRKAFEAVGLEDGTASAPTMTGGDPSRSRTRLPLLGI